MVGQGELNNAWMIREFVQKLQNQSNHVSFNFNSLWAKVWPTDGPVLASYPIRLNSLENKVTAVCWVLTTRSLNYVDITKHTFRVQSYRLDRYLYTDMSLALESENDSLTMLKKTIKKKRYRQDVFQFVKPERREYLWDYINFIKQL